MKPIFLIMLISCFTLQSSMIAHAHVGHLGELAGHSHWIGLGAVAAAGALAAILGKLYQNEDDEDAQEADPEPVEEAA